MGLDLLVRQRGKTIRVDISFMLGIKGYACEGSVYSMLDIVYALAPLFVCFFTFIVALLNCSFVWLLSLVVSLFYLPGYMYHFRATPCFCFCFSRLTASCFVMFYVSPLTAVLLYIFFWRLFCCCVCFCFLLAAVLGFFHLVHTPSSCFVGLASQGRASKGGTVRLQRRGAAPVLRSPEGVDQYVVYDSRLVCAAAVPATAITAMLLILILLTTLLASEGGAPALPLPLPPLHFLRIGFPIDVWIFDKCQRYSP